MYKRRRVQKQLFYEMLYWQGKGVFSFFFFQLDELRVLRVTNRKNNFFFTKISASDKNRFAYVHTYIYLFIKQIVIHYIALARKSTNASYI